MNKAFFFTPYYNNAQVNSILIMDTEGTILEVNRAFTHNFGYSNERISGQNFTILFTPEDRKHNKPQLELQSVIRTGQANDENYIVNDQGFPLWALGESLLVSDEGGKQFIVKDIVNLQAKKQLQLFLTDTEELLERVYESSRDVAMMVLDGGMKLLKVNAAFLQLFGIENPPPSGSRLFDLNHPFWNNTDIKKEVTAMIVTNKPLKHKEFLVGTKKGENKKVKLFSRIIEGQGGAGRKLFIMIEEMLV